MIVIVDQKQEIGLKTCTFSSNCCGYNFQSRQDNDLMNYEQKNTSSDQGHEYQKMTRLILIIRRKNKI
jgi:hypothetical protein